MSWFTDQRKKIEKESVRLRKHVQEETKRFKEWYDKHGPEEIKIEAKSTNDGANWEIEPKVKPNTNINTKTTNKQQGKPNAYSRSAAATSTDIAQGGMTKEEVEEYNIKHPNETAIRRNY